VASGAGNFRVFLAVQPLFDNQAAVREGAAHVFDGGAQWQLDVLFAQGLEVATEGTLAAIKETIGQVFEGEQAALLEGFMADANQAVAAQGQHAPSFPDLEIFVEILQSQHDQGLAAIDQARTRRGFDRKDGQENSAGA